MHKYSKSAEYETCLTVLPARFHQCRVIPMLRSSFASIVACQWSSDGRSGVEGGNEERHVRFDEVTKLQMYPVLQPIRHLQQAEHLGRHPTNTLLQYLPPLSYTNIMGRHHLGPASYGPNIPSILSTTFTSSPLTAFSLRCDKRLIGENSVVRMTILTSQLKDPKAFLPAHSLQ